MVAGVPRPQLFEAPGESRTRSCSRLLDMELARLGEALHSLADACTAPVAMFQVALERARLVSETPVHTLLAWAGTLTSRCACVVQYFWRLQPFCVAQCALRDDARAGTMAVFASAVAQDLAAQVMLLEQEQDTQR